jgi:alanyl-tRNA synthetase
MEIHHAEVHEKVAKQHSRVFSGEIAFRLHDTYGFPIDLTQLMAGGHGLAVDMVRFGELMEEQKNRSRHSLTSTARIEPKAGRKLIRGKETARTFDAVPSRSRFVGYESLEAKTVIVAARDNLAILAETPFYAES